MVYRLVHDGAGTVLALFETGKNTQTYTKFTLVELPDKDACLVELDKLGAKEVYIDSVKQKLTDQIFTNLFSR